MTVWWNRTRGVWLAGAAMAGLVAGTALGQTHRQAASASFGPASPWSLPIQLSTGSAIGSPGGTHPLAVQGKAVHASWVQNGIVNLSSSPDGGASWGQAMQVTFGRTALYPCSLEVGESVLHLIWPDSRNDGLWEPYYKRSTDGGKTIHVSAKPLRVTNTQTKPAATATGPTED